MTHAPIRAFDFGGSGVKTAVYDVTSSFGYRVGAFAAQYAALFHARVPGWMSDNPILQRRPRQNSPTNTRSREWSGAHNGGHRHFGAV